MRATVVIRGASLAVCCTAAVAALMARAQAGPEDDRRRLIEEIDRLLDDAADDLDGFGGESSTSDLDRALDRVSKVRDKARELEKVQGDDSRARDMAYRYPGYADRFREAGGNLRPLKEAQRTLDEQPRACQERKRELEAKVRTYLDRNDPAGVIEIPRLAQEYGRPIAEMLERTARRKEELGRLRDSVRYFSESDGRWSDVRSELHDAANEILDYWMRKYDEVQRECVELGRQERAPMIEAALARLATSEQGRQAIFKEITDELADATRLVTDVESDSDDGDVKAAERDVEDLKRLLDRLKAAAGEDRRAREVADRWPGEIEAMGRALLALDELKDYQFRADKAPERCRAEDEKIVRAADALERLDPLESDVSSIERAADDLDAVATSARNGLLEALRKTAEAKREVEDVARKATNWSPSPTELRSVDEELDESAADVAKHFTQAEAASQTACATPALGPEHPAAKKAKTSKFGDCTKAQWVPLRNDVNKWCVQTSRKCYSGDSKSVLTDKIKLYDACIAARTTLTETCYRNARDVGHPQAVAQEREGKRNCETLLAALRS